MLFMTEPGPNVLSLIITFALSIQEKYSSPSLHNEKLSAVYDCTCTMYGIVTIILFYFP